MDSVRWVAARIQILFRASYAPEVALDPPPSGSSFLIPLLLFGAGSVLLTWLQLPLNLQWAQNQMEASGVPAGQIAEGLETLRASNHVASILVPLVLFLKWSAFAGMLWLAANALLASAPYWAMLNLVAYSYLPIIARDFTIYLIVLLRGDAALTHREGLNVAIGLNLLFPSMPLPWSALAGNINLFEAWFAVIVVTGLGRTIRQSWKKAVAVFLPMWIVVWLLQFAMVSVGLSLRSSIAGQP